MIKHCLKIIIPIFLFFVLSSCSYTYDQGVQLESEERWAEAEIEYRKAYIEDPDDEEIKTALARVRQKTSAENFQVYQDYLAEKKFRKAYRRLESALSQNPNLIEAQAELKHWRHLLITGKVEFEFDRFGSNIQLAEEMHLEIRINAPNQKILTRIISGESGVFFIEDLVYQANISDLASYSINSIGLKIKRRNSQGFQQSEFKKFINFRDLKPFQISGKLQTDNGRNPINLLEHRPGLQSLQKSDSPWYPPIFFDYELELKKDSIRVISENKRIEFAPAVLYVNGKSRRAMIDFGSYLLQLKKGQSKWSILRKVYRNNEDDYIYELSNNLALNRYFFYEKAYTFSQ